MSDSSARMLRVAAARADFLEYGGSGAAGVSDVVVASWERSQAAGVDISRPNAQFTDEIDAASLLVRCAQPVLQQLQVDTADMPLVIALTDKRARVVQRIDSSPAVARLLDRVHLAPGFSYAESSMGTNGIGTVFEAGQPISVVGPEHFSENLHLFACTGAPVIDPVTGRVEGVLDISTLSSSWSPLMHTLVKSAAKDIGRNFLLDRGQAQRAIFETYLKVVARSARQAVFAFGDSVFVASAAAQQMFDAEEQRIMREHAMFLMAGKDRVSDTITLPGHRLVHVRGTRILAGVEVAGMVVIADLVTSSQPGSPDDFSEQQLPQVAVATPQTSQIVGGLWRSRDSLAGGTTPAWIRACGDLRQALELGRPALVVGEPGSGKFTLVAELFHSVYPGGRAISVDAGQLGVDGAPSDLSSLLGDSAEPTLHIIRDIDQASTDGVERLDAYLTAVAAVNGPVWVVATGSDCAATTDLPFRELLHHFEASITIPPLRCRTDDLPALTAALLRGIAPERKVRLSPAAQRLIARYSWPRNISQLREALVHALRRRPVGEIQESDLPGYCQTASRHALTPLEAAERDAIVAALRDMGGNRVAAAAHLGMSRSSLYRKVKTYGIVT
ncbi:Fis family transcriptional regulator [Mycolicibacterium mageritense DSM 44476 = CIP 104973]|uniref:Fis family transcriptional regulator n=1 Tax=Mycolicibacterium mageritense TaxID=53462 RepID=A0AAI8XNM0_MYCME|nr:helix-turn-helix domain-containing protein [Mycolicibacterium mageritense]OKH80631.1 transcriptional regulator [Mycobacterium sp. SWH-M3]MCC9180644.1 GAF domain-containing protein [Mycolicibacterium mageritense]TXI61324.1 MAG: GAF domain-containing protein [Mycolicibacterium mageritense]CDO23063.1 Fis family transcriptional regulator [Mycolicibacterium mageritense DSM 44476 = CIP 104973]BBX32395.1 Fis family transcriptional regulator [Mycolicibacterium mageritense]